jgi:putative transposase
MSNVRRLRTSDRVFFVTANLRRTAAPLTTREFPLVIEAFARSRARLRFALYGYVLMPDHWHALIWTSYPVTISHVMREVKRLSALNINRERGTSGALWQHQFWDRFVRDAQELAQRLDYMHSNPVKRALVGKPEEWAWSSCNNFSLDESMRAACPITIDYVSLPESYRA